MAETNANSHQIQGDTNSNSPTPAATHFVEVLRQVLITPCNPNRAPNQFWGSLDTASSAPEGSILLRAGFKVWFAYFLALEQGTANGLDQLSSADIAVVIGEIARIPPHESITQLFSHLSTGWRGKARRKWLELEPPYLDPHPPKRAQISVYDSAIQSDPMANAETANNPHLLLANTQSDDDRHLRAESARLFPIYGAIGFEIDPGSQVAWPVTRDLGLVFPRYLTSAIATMNGKAWLMVSFKHIYECELELFILAAETQHVVKELFDLHLTIRDGQRGILLDNGVSQKLKGCLEISGSPLNKVEKLIGEEATEAYRLSPSRMKEIDRGQIHTTDCLALEVWPETECPTRLKLRAEVMKLSILTSKLGL